MIVRFLGDAQTETWSALTRALQEAHFAVTARSEAGFPPKRRAPTMVRPNHAVAPVGGTLSISVSGRTPREQPEERIGEARDSDSILKDADG